MSIVSAGSPAGRPVCAGLALPTNVHAAKDARGKTCTGQKIHTAKDEHSDPQNALEHKAC